MDELSVTSAVARERYSLASFAVADRPVTDPSSARRRLGDAHVGERVRGRGHVIVRSEARHELGVPARRTARHRGLVNLARVIDAMYPGPSKEKKAPAARRRRRGPR